MEADVVVRARVRNLASDFDPQVLAEEIKEKGLQPSEVALRRPEMEIGSVLVIGEDGRDGEI